MFPSAMSSFSPCVCVCVFCVCASAYSYAMPFGVPSLPPTSTYYSYPPEVYSVGGPPPPASQEGRTKEEDLLLLLREEKRERYKQDTGAWGEREWGEREWDVFLEGCDAGWMDGRASE